MRETQTNKHHAMGVEYNTQHCLIIKKKRWPPPKRIKNNKTLDENHSSIHPASGGGLGREAETMISIHSFIHPLIHPLIRPSTHSSIHSPDEEEGMILSPFCCSLLLDSFLHWFDWLFVCLIVWLCVCLIDWLSCLGDGVTHPPRDIIPPCAMCYCIPPS